MFKFTQVLMEEAGPDGVGGGAGGESTQTPSASPNDNWQDNAKLDENGNPIGGQQPQQEQETPPAGDTPPADGDGDNTTPEPKDFDFNTPVVQQIEQLVVDAGLDAGEVAKSVTENNGEVTPALAKKLVEKHGEAVAGLIISQLKGFHSANKAKSEARDNAIFSQVEESFKGVTEQSGQDTWKELSTWAKENVPNDERKEINKILQQGGLGAKYAVDDLVNRFKSSESFVQSADLITGDRVTDSSGVTPLSKSDYQRKFRELEAKGHVYGQSQELAQLDKQREAGMRKGI